MQINAVEQTRVLLAMPPRLAQPKSSRVGYEYQTQMCDELSSWEKMMYRPPPTIADPKLVWSKNMCKLTEKQLADYVASARSLNKYRHGLDQILGILHWNEYNTEAALSDLAAFCPHPDGVNGAWAAEEIKLFEVLLAQHGKVFHEISRGIPGRSTASVIKYYYHWKKTGKVARSVEKLALEIPAAAEYSRRAVIGEGTEGGYESVAARRIRQSIQKNPPGNVCGNCAAVPDRIHQPGPTSILSFETCHLCSVCASFFFKWGRDRPTSARDSGANAVKRPKFETFNAEQPYLTTPPNNQSEADFNELKAICEKLDNRYLAEVAVQDKGRSAFQQLHREHFTDEYKISSARRATTSSRTGGRRGPGASIWSEPEVELVCEGLVKYGKNFAAIQKLLNGRKTIQQLRNWFFNYRKKRNLDFYVKKHRRERKL